MMDATEQGDSLHLTLYRMALLIRRCQELVMAEYHPADEMRCPIHFCVGQESAPAALAPLLRHEDVVMSHHRSHGYYLAKGGSLQEMIAEFYGKSTGCNGGLAGSQELSRHSSNFFSGTILSGMFAMATGAAFAQKYNATKALTCAVIGDGGMEEGIVFEALNLAAVFNLPVLFLCENNLYSAHTHIDSRSISQTLVGKAEAFGIESKLLDGNDPILLHEAFQNIFSRIRKGEGPAFAEIRTYRTCGHVGPEDDDILDYRSNEELQKWLSRDPISFLRNTLIKNGASKTSLKTIDNEIDSMILIAIENAKKAPFPDFEQALKLNFADVSSELAQAIPKLGPLQFDGNQKETKLMPY